MAENFWENVQQILNQMGQTQKWLSDQSGVTRTAINSGISKNTKGENPNPRADVAYKIAQVLQTSVEYLVTGKDPEGFPPEIILVAKEIAKLSPPEQDEIMVLVQYKLSKRPEEGGSPEAPQSSGHTAAMEPAQAVSDYIDVVAIPNFGRMADSLNVNRSPDEFMHFPRAALKGNPKDFFAFTMTGYSMIHAGIGNGDLIIVKRADQPAYGKIMLVRFQDTITLKWVIRRGEKDYLKDGEGKKIEATNQYQPLGICAFLIKQFPVLPIAAGDEEPETIPRKPDLDQAGPPLFTLEPAPVYGGVPGAPGAASDTPHKEEVVKIPLVGSTAAGKPINFADLDPNPPTRLFSASLIRGDIRDYYCVVVRGTSMTEADIQDGDYALIRHTEKPIHGQIMLVHDEDSSTLKRINIIEDFKGIEEIYICWEDGSGHRAKLDREGYEIQGGLIGVQREAWADR